jgi:hypothetical protein
MIELARSNDLVFLSWLLAALQHEGIEAIVLDAHASVADGSLSAIPRRVMVDDGDERAAWRVLALADELGRNG